MMDTLRRTWLTTLRRVLLGLSGFVLAGGLLGWAGLRFEGEMFAFMGIGVVGFVLMLFLIAAHALLVLAGRRGLIIQAFGRTPLLAVLTLAGAGLALAVIGRVGLGSGAPEVQQGGSSELMAAGVLTAMFAMMAGFAGMLSWAGRQPAGGPGGRG